MFTSMQSPRTVENYPPYHLSFIILFPFILYFVISLLIYARDIKVSLSTYLHMFEFFLVMFLFLYPSYFLLLSHLSFSMSTNLGIMLLLFFTASYLEHYFM